MIVAPCKPPASALPLSLRDYIWHQYAQQPCPACGRTHYQQQTTVNGTLCCPPDPCRGVPTNIPGGTCFNPCATPCVNRCINPCVSPHPGPCANPCQSPCANPCSSPRANPCSSPCANPCSSPRANPCSSPCANPCVNPCPSPCLSPRPSPCSGISVCPDSKLSGPVNSQKTSQSSCNRSECPFAQSKRTPSLRRNGLEPEYTPRQRTNGRCAYLETKGEPCPDCSRRTEGMSSFSEFPETPSGLPTCMTNFDPNKQQHPNCQCFGAPPVPDSKTRAVLAVNDVADKTVQSQNQTSNDNPQTSETRIINANYLKELNQTKNGFHSSDMDTFTESDEHVCCRCLSQGNKAKSASIVDKEETELGEQKSTERVVSPSDKGESDIRSSVSPERKAPKKRCCHCSKASSTRGFNDQMQNVAKQLPCNCATKINTCQTLLRNPPGEAKMAGDGGERRARRTSTGRQYTAEPSAVAEPSIVAEPSVVAKQSVVVEPYQSSEKELETAGPSDLCSKCCTLQKAREEEEKAKKKAKKKCWSLFKKKKK